MQEQDADLEKDTPRLKELKGAHFLLSALYTHWRPLDCPGVCRKVAPILALASAEYTCSYINPACVCSPLDDESDLVMETANFLQELCLRAEEKVAAAGGCPAELLACPSASDEGPSSTRD